jgi:hypothetical protein
MASVLVRVAKWVVGVGACAVVATGCFNDAPDDAAPEEGQVNVSESLTFYGGETFYGRYCANLPTGDTAADHEARKPAMRVTDQVYSFLSGGTTLPPDKYGTPAFQSGNCGAAIADLTRMRNYTIDTNLGYSGKTDIPATICHEGRRARFFLVPNDATLDQLIPRYSESEWPLPGDRLAARLISCWGRNAMVYLLPSTETHSVQDRLTRKLNCVHTIDGSSCDDTPTEPTWYRALLLDPEIAQLGATAPTSNGASAPGTWLATGDGVNIVRWYSYYVSNAGLYPGMPCFTYTPAAYAQTTKRLVPAAVGSTYYACL